MESRNRPTPDQFRSRETIGSREIHIEQKSLVFIMGLPGSGKSTFAHDHFPQDSIVSTDNIRREMTNNPSNHIVSNRAFLLARRIIQERLRNGAFAVVDAQNISENNREAFIEAAREEGASVHVISLDVDVEEAVERDNARTRRVGEKYIRDRAHIFQHELRMLQKHRADVQLDVLSSDQIGQAVVELPEDAKEQLEADREFAGRAREAEYLLALSETGFLRREQEPGERTHELEAGSVLFADDSPETRKLLDDSLLPHQVIDIEQIARRMATTTDSEEVRDVTQYLLKLRVHHNLTTAVLRPDNFDSQETLNRAIEKEEGAKNITIPTSSLSQKEAAQLDRIEITRDANDDTPLLLVGDVHGAYTAMRELAGRVRRENLEAKAGGSEHERQIVFVGDMADRGPLDAETVIYITSLVRAGRAKLIKGNHDEHLLQALKGEQVQSKATRKTAEDLQKRLKPASIQRIVTMLEAAPTYAEWKGLVAVHGSLPRIPRTGEVPSDELEQAMLFGKSSGQFRGGRREVFPLRMTVAHDPNQLIVGGHTHEGEPSLHGSSGSINLDADAEKTGVLWGMYYPELSLTTAEQPETVRLFEMLKTGELPQGQDLVLFVEYARQQGMVKTKEGEGEYEGLTIVSYTPTTELGNLWAEYPTLRNFRGLIIDREGNVVARPFKKTHKANVEIPLSDLAMKPSQVFEKANGTLIVMYHHNGTWRTSTKFSFDNETYTQVADRLLQGADREGLDPRKTYLFEIILPDDPHIVDYDGEEALVLLNAIENETGHIDSWDHIQEKAAELGVRTAHDMTDVFPDMTIADIYRRVQQPGATENLEGLMAIYPGPDGEPLTVKVKAREYDDKKFVRDRLDWGKIFDRLDGETLTMSERDQDELLLYQYDNPFVVSALETRLEWIQTEAQRLCDEVRQILLGPMENARSIFERSLEATGNPKQALGAAMKAAAKEVMAIVKGRPEFDKGSVNSFMGFLRKTISGDEDPDRTLNMYVLKILKARTEAEIEKRGRAAYWLLPE